MYLRDTIKSGEARVVRSISEVCVEVLVEWF